MALMTPPLDLAPAVALVVGRGDFAAAAIQSGPPITAVFLLAQRWMIAGLAAGGVKG